MRRTPLRKVSKKRQREMPKMREWRDAVFKRDIGVCVACGGHGEHAHHIRGRNVAPDQRYDTMNGLCMCSDCHASAHGYPKEFKLWLKVTFPEQHAYLYEVKNE
jgi:hypothetical protein